MFTVSYLRLTISIPGRQCFFGVECVRLLLRLNASHNILSLKYECCVLSSCFKKKSKQLLKEQ